MDKDEDITVISGSHDITLDISDYGAALSTVVIDPSAYSAGASITSPSTITWTQPYENYTISTGTSWNIPSVNITTDGMTMNDNCDLKIGDRSLKDFMDKVEDQLAILRPAPELEEKWDQLKELRRQYETLKHDILEKEKLMKILKEK